MPRKRYALDEVPALVNKHEFRRRFRGVQNRDFVLAFFGGMVNSQLSRASGVQQLFILYVTYLIARVALRHLKRNRVDLSTAQHLVFHVHTDPTHELNETQLEQISECLNYSNVFLDYRKMRVAFKK
eukprot:710380-Karenia_brevis.AAC.1